jgi:hypothetical protein
MFFGMAELLVPITKIGTASVIEAKRLNYAMIEAFVVHLRNLIEFLYIERPQTTDVVASDFCAAWQTLRPAISATLKNARARANKELAHLTTARQTGVPQSKQWEFSVLAGEIKSLLQLSVKHARSTALFPGVAQVIG